MPASLKDKKVLIAIILVLVLALLGVAGFIILGQNKPKTTEDSNTEVPTQSSNQKTEEEGVSDVRWETTGEGGWLALGTPPDCPDPFKIESPTDISKVTSILYPGQVRGGDYKPHGGFRFDNSKPADISVTSPTSGYVFRGGRYLAGGELQYTFDIINPCGFMVRLGHLLTLSPTFQAYAEKFPPAAEGDSRTEKITSYPIVKKGDVIATAVGLTNGTNNAFFDFGVYDLRKQNEASKSTAYQQAHSDEKEQSFFSVCWFDLLPTADATKVKSLPAADGVSGKTSDYCK